MRKQISHFSLTILFWFVNILLAITTSTFLYLIFSAIRSFYHATDLKPILNVGSTVVSSFAIFTVLSDVIVLWVFRKFIRNIKNGQTFTEENIGLLNKFCTGLIVVCALSFIQKLAYYHFFAAPSGTNYPTWSFNIWLLILALVIWTFSYTFSIGKNLQKETDLTI